MKKLTRHGVSSVRADIVYFYKRRGLEPFLNGDSGATFYWVQQPYSTDFNFYLCSVTTLLVVAEPDLLGTQAFYGFYTTKQS